MGSCQKSAYHERNKALQEKQKDNCCFSSARVNKKEPEAPINQIKPVYFAEKNKAAQPIELPPQFQESIKQQMDGAIIQQMDRAIIQYPKIETEQQQSAKQEQPKSQECKLISNYGNLCNHPECAQKIPSTLLSPRSNKLGKCKRQLKQNSYPRENSEDQ